MRVKIFLALAWLLASPCLAATSSGWISTDAAEKMAADMREKQMRLIDIDCRQDETVVDAEKTSFLMTWEPNVGNWQWSWREAMTPVLQGYKHEFAAKGFTLVVERSFTMASGAQRSCALWHGKPGESGAVPPPADP